MDAEALEALLDDLEAGLAQDIQAALTLTAHNFADAVNAANDLTAASFSVSKISGMWKKRVGGIMTRLRKLAGRGAVTVVDDLDADDIPTADLDRALKPYMEATQQLLDAVGERLAAEATQALADGVEAGDSIDQLQQRLVDLFSQDGTKLGPGRAARIAATEATRAFNAGALAAAQELTGPDRPLVKQWQTRRDTKVREPHADADGQLQLLDDAFQVGGVPMQYPGDPTAPAALTINCRCIMRVEPAPQGRTASVATDDDDALQSRMPRKLLDYWVHGEGAAKIGWGTPGDFKRCVRLLGDEVPATVDVEGTCANLHHEALGKWPGQEAGDTDEAAVAAAVNPDGTVHTGAMVAFLPTQDDMDRLALDGGEPAGQLHVTAFYLGDAADWDADARGQVIQGMAYAARTLGPIPARAFGVALWNPSSDEPAHVWNVGDDRSEDAYFPAAPTLADARYEVQYALEDRHGGPDLPQQHSPWQPHICAAYGEADQAAMVDRTGPITLDRLVVAFGGEWTVIPLTGSAETPWDGPEPDAAEPLGELVQPAPTTAFWSTPGATALAFENQQTGDGRVFVPGALQWEGSGPWPLQYADAMLGGHDGARLAGSIWGIGRDGDRIPGHGVLYLNQAAGWEATSLLAQGAPLGVSVDLDNVDMEMVVADNGDSQGDPWQDEPFTARLVTASLLPLPDGGFLLHGETEPATVVAANGATVEESSRVVFTVGPDGRIPAAAFDMSAAAGESANVPGGIVVEQQRAGDVLMRITRARVRGATLVTIPAYANARIVLDDPELFAAAGPVALTDQDSEFLTDMVDHHTEAIAMSSQYLDTSDPAERNGQVAKLAQSIVSAQGGEIKVMLDWLSGGRTASAIVASATSDYDRVVRHVVRTSLPSTAASVARYLKISTAAARRHLARAARKGDLVKLHRGTYVAPTTTDSNDDDTATASAATAVADGLPDDLTAAATGAVDLPVASQDTAWDGDGAKTRVFAWADGDTDKVSRAFAYRDDSADPANKGAYKLGYADVVDGTLTIVPKGVSAALGALNGARGGTDIPSDQVDAVRSKLEAVQAHVAEVNGGDGREKMEASAWSAMADLPPMPADWFSDPTDLLPKGGPGVNYANGRIFGWVAQAGEPHAGFARKITIDGLGKIDTQHFLRQRFTLDDGSVVKAGAFTMNVGHHRDGAECETAACQFDDTRTVAGIVTVGVNDRGMWFSGAAAPWMSEWDRQVFAATQPSYHMKKGPSGNWQLRAVLSVPVPGHSSPLMASAVVERAQVALTAAATIAETEAAVKAEQDRQDATAAAAAADDVTAPGVIDYDRLADALVAAMARADQKKLDDAAELEALLAEGQSLDTDA